MAEKSTQKLTWHSVANPSIGQLGGTPEKSSGRHYVPPKEKLREWAMKSKEGGTMWCEFCSHYFAAYYIKRVKKTPFVTTFACLDCQKEKGLQIVR